MYDIPQNITARVRYIRERHMSRKVVIDAALGKKEHRAAGDVYTSRLTPIFFLQANP
jgi:hypothetical protein